MKPILIHLLLHAALLWKGAGSIQLFNHTVIASTAPMDVYLGLEQPEWIQLTNEEHFNVTLAVMHVVVTPAKCYENSTKLICFEIQSKNTSANNGTVLRGECDKKQAQKNYSSFVLPPGEQLVLQITMCPDPSSNGSGHTPEGEPLCNITSPDCLCVNACLPMWVALRLDAVYSNSYGGYEILDREPEKTLLLSLHHNTNSNNTTTTNTTELHSCAQLTWAQEHVGTIVASAVALLLLGVVVALLGCITGYWRRDKAKQKTFTPEAHIPSPLPQEREQQEEEERYTEVREEVREVSASSTRGSYEDVMMSSERRNSRQGLVTPLPVTYSSSVTRSTQQDRVTYSQEPGIPAKEYEVPLTSSKFWQPTPVESEIVTYMSRRNMALVQQDAVKLLEKLGEGEFGCVFRGLWHREGGSVLDVAVKLARDGTCEVDRTKLLQEAAIMAQFSHKNVVTLLGVVRNTANVMIITEFLCNGDLRLYLKSVEMEITFTPNLLENLPRKLLDFCSQVAQGMKYLSQKAFVHRDLAARNILLDKNYICKIADFGLSRDLAEGDYYRSRGGKIPIKWTAPEALHYHKYSTSSDVWSYGMVLFEIWSLGHKPFEDLSVTQVANLPTNGYTQSPPPGCPRRVYQLMVDCWNPNADKRPSFSGIVQYLSQPKAALLHWSDADRTKSPSCAILGAELEAGRILYQDLQKRHNTQSGGKAHLRLKVETLNEETMMGY